MSFVLQNEKRRKKKQREAESWVVSATQTWKLDGERNGGEKKNRGSVTAVSLQWKFNGLTCGAGGAEPGS